MFCHCLERNIVFNNIFVAYLSLSSRAPVMLNKNQECEIFMQVFCPVQGCVFRKQIVQ